jgi:hypothetical protein
MISPIGLVFESDKTRSLLQPWIDSTSASSTIKSESTTIVLEPIDIYLESVLNAIAELFLIGIERSTSHRWQELRETGEKLGFKVFSDAIANITTQLDRPAQDLHALTQAILTLSVLHHLTTSH